MAKNFVFYFSSAILVVSMVGCRSNSSSELGSDTTVYNNDIKVSASDSYDAAKYLEKLKTRVENNTNVEFDTSNKSTREVGLVLLAQSLRTNEDQFIKLIDGIKRVCDVISLNLYFNSRVDVVKRSHKVFWSEKQCSIQLLADSGRIFSQEAEGKQVFKIIEKQFSFVKKLALLDGNTSEINPVGSLFQSKNAKRFQWIIENMKGLLDAVRKDASTDTLFLSSRDDSIFDGAKVFISINESELDCLKVFMKMGKKAPCIKKKWK